MNFLGYGSQSISESDIEAVVQVLRGSHLTQGPAVKAFEDSLADYVGARFAVVVANGTAALHVACLAAGVKSSDIGVTQTLTFVASANAITYCGARPDLVDVDLETLGMSPVALQEYLNRVPECKVVIPVAMGGLSSDSESIRKVAANRIIIEDACHALGGINRDGKKVGGGDYADMTVFSFHPVKPITTGEGGAIVTNNKDLYEKLLVLRSHGIVRKPGLFVRREAEDWPWYYEQQQLGFNYRMCDIQAALGASQLRRLDTFISRRRSIAKIYDSAFRDCANLKLVQSSRDLRTRSGHHLYSVWLDFNAIGKTRTEVMRSLSEEGIGTQVHYIPVHRQPYYRDRFKDCREMFRNAEHYYQGCLTLPCYPSLQDEDIERVISAVKKYVS